MAIERTPEDKLRSLYRLQLIDSELDQIQILKGELPMEVSDLEDEIAGLQTRVNKLENHIADIDDEIKRHHAKIEEAKILKERYTQQMDEVKNNREYEALTKEIEMQDLDSRLAEKKIGQAEKRKVERQEVLDSTKERLAMKNENLEAKQKELEKIIAKTEKDEKRLRKQSEKAAKEVEERLLKGYTKIRGAYRNGLAVVHVERDACGGCFNYIPPQQQLEIAIRKKILTCEHCGRVLVDENILEENTIASK